MAKIKSTWSYFVDRLPRPLRNKYVTTSLVFLVWLVFLDSNSFLAQRKTNNVLKDLSDKKSFYTAEIRRLEQSRADIFTNDRSREKFAREQYHMKKENEDIFVFEKK